MVFDEVFNILVRRERNHYSKTVAPISFIFSQLTLIKCFQKQVTEYEKKYLLNQITNVKNRHIFLKKKIVLRSGEKNMQKYLKTKKKIWQYKMLCVFKK